MTPEEMEERDVVEFTDEAGNTLLRSLPRCATPGKTRRTTIPTTIRYIS